jgi:hypothetical protein
LRFVQGYDPTRPLATWWFFHPRLAALSATEKPMYRHILAIMLKRGRISKSDEAFLLTCLTDNVFKDVVVRIEQFHGEGVHVPSGWAHMVWNVQPCVKYAWDLYVPEHFPAYMKAWDVASALFLAKGKKGPSNDYMRVPLVVVRYLIDHAKSVCDMIREEM